MAGSGHASSLVDRGDDVNDVMELRADGPDVLDSLGPRDDRPIAGSAEVRWHALRPLEGRRPSPRPTHRVMVVRFRPTQFVDQGQLRLDRVPNAVHAHHAVAGAREGSFRARAVVAGHVDDHRVVTVGQLSDGIDQSPDVVVRVGEECREDFHVPGVEPLLIGRERVPTRDLFRPWREQRVLRDHSQLLLPMDGLFTDRIPALIELAFEFGDPFVGDMQRRVGRAGGKVHEVGLVWSDRLLPVEPGNGVINQVFGQVVTLLRLLPRFNREFIAKQLRLPLAGFAAMEAVEVLEPEAGRPAMERADRRGIPVGRVVPLAPDPGAVTILLEHACHTCRLARPDAVIPRETS